MPENNAIETRYQQRLARYTTALRNEQPDRVPLRPFVAEFTGVHAGYTCQQMAHQYALAFEAARRCAADFDWDAVVPNMIATWTGMTQAMGLRYYMTPGIDLPPNVGHQYLEPPAEAAFMKVEEYQALIEDPTGFLYSVWLPRVTAPILGSGLPDSVARDLSLVKGAMAMSRFFNDWGQQEQRLREESGTVSAIAGMLKAPLDLLADKLRGYVGLAEDLIVRPRQVLAACEALMPHLEYFARVTADPNRNVPIGFWMHRSCVPLISFKHFNEIGWPTLKPIIQDLWSQGHQTLFYAEGNWDHHLSAFGELPDRSIVYHVDRGDVFQAHRALGDKFCLSGGIPNTLLSCGTQAEVRAACRQVIEGIGRNGGYIMDAGAIIQNDAKVENLRALTEATLEYGVYSRGHAVAPLLAGGPKPVSSDIRSGPSLAQQVGPRPPGVCIPWREVLPQLPPLTGDPGICQEVWESVDTLGYLYVWWILLAF
jgi:methoxylated aromatic compound---corrinoid protein Co-methyltransferase